MSWEDVLKKIDKKYNSIGTMSDMDLGIETFTSGCLSIDYMLGG